MEVPELVTGIIGLYKACQSCYHLYTDTTPRGAQSDITAAIQDFRVHESILKAWAFYWEILEDGSTKLELYLKRYPNKAIGVASALQRTGDVLSDRDRLLATYGLEASFDYAGNTVQDSPSPVTWKKLLSGVRDMTDIISSRIKLNRIFTWTLRDATKLKGLIIELKENNDVLHVLSPEATASELLQINLALDLLPQWQETDLRQQQSFPFGCLFGSIESYAHRLLWLSPSDESRRVLSELADIKLAALDCNKTETITPEDERRLICFQPGDLHHGPSNMAVWGSGKETVLLERISYSAATKPLEEEIRASILKLGQLLMLPSCFKHLRTLELLGLVEYSNSVIALVYRLPGTLGQPRPGFPIHDMDARRPRNLLFPRPDNYEETDPYDLGWRFDLARKLTRSVAFMHASGWLHKDIRMSEICFFPKAESQISRKQIEMNYDAPYLLGFTYSRPDDIKDIRHMRSSSPLPFSILRPIPPPPPPPPYPAIWQAQENSEDDEEQACLSNESLETDDSNSTRTVPAPPYIREKTMPAPNTNRVNLDIRHHPYRRMYPNRRYRHAFDLYSLGIVLVEIGMGQVLESVFPGAHEPDPYLARRMLLSWVQEKMPPVCGKIYTEATMACLEIDPEESEAELATQRELCARIAIQLAQCRA